MLTKVHRCRFCKRRLIKGVYCDSDCKDKNSKRKNKQKKAGRKGLIKQLDELVREIVFLRDPVCVTCGTDKNPTPGHLFTRGWYAIRWDLQNVWKQCAGCNLYHESDPHPFNSWFINKFGKQAWDDLHTRGKVTTHYKAYDLQALHDQLKGKNEAD